MGTCRHDNCFSCPYPDCIASGADIAKKSKAERNRTILEDFNNGVSVNGIAERLGVSGMTVRRVLKDNGITEFRQKWEIQQWEKHNENNINNKKNNPISAR